MSDILKEQLIVAGYNTVFILSLVILLGLILNAIKMQMLKWCCSLFGKTIGEFLVNRFTFIGVIHHELSHAFMALLCGAQVTEVNVLKFRGDTLGNVKFIPRGPKVFRRLQMCLAALAPSICGLCTLYMMIYFINLRMSLIGWQWAVIIYIEISILLHMTLSSVDIKAALKGMFSTLLLTYGILFILKINVVMNICYIFRQLLGNIA